MEVRVSIFLGAALELFIRAIMIFDCVVRIYHQIKLIRFLNYVIRACHLNYSYYYYWNNRCIKIISY